LPCGSLGEAMRASAPDLRVFSTHRVYWNDREAKISAFHGEHVTPRLVQTHHARCKASLLLRAFVRRASGRPGVRGRAGRAARRQTRSGDGPRSAGLVPA
jgi:hypothetical protein